MLKKAATSQLITVAPAGCEKRDMQPSAMSNTSDAFCILDLHKILLSIHFNTITSDAFIVHDSSHLPP
jgi:hypothetical protein